MKRLLIVEDGQEYLEFARLFLADAFDVTAARSGGEALAALKEGAFDVILFDMRFERTAPELLVGDVNETARRLFGGDLSRALRYLKDQQGTLVLAQIRAAGYAQPAIFIHDFADRRLGNLRKLYGDVRAVPGFDARAIREALGAT